MGAKYGVYGRLPRQKLLLKQKPDFIYHREIES